MIQTVTKVIQGVMNTFAKKNLIQGRAACSALVRRCAAAAAAVPSSVLPARMFTPLCASGLG